MATDFLSGFVTLVGRPNVGKSTLMNHFVGEKISIISKKPQTTRNKIRAIHTGEAFQIVFIDTPGIHTPKTKLGKFMVKSAKSAISEVDAVVYIVEPKTTIDDENNAIIESLKIAASPIFLAINKVDTVKKPELLKIIEIYHKTGIFKEIIPLSALTGENTDKLLLALLSVLPKGPMYFPEDQITDQPERQIAGEIIREKALMYLQEEIPHGLAVEVTAMKPGKAVYEVGATIFCERDSHKGIIIGQKGEVLKKIGSAARRDIERLLGEKVYLDLWVKVKKNWRDDEFLLRGFGYSLK